MLDHHGELLALWEGGSASLLDRDTLAWRGFKVWGERLEGLPFTAHPKVEPDGTLWAFGYSLAPVRALVLYHIGPDGEPRKVQPIDAGPLGMVHDFVVTARHLVIVIPPLVFEPAPERERLLDALLWRPALGTRALVVDKDGFGARRWYQLPAGFGFHHGNGWEDAGGVIRFDHCVATDATLMRETMHFVMRGSSGRRRRNSTPASRSTPTGARRSSPRARKRNSRASRPRGRAAAIATSTPSGRCRDPRRAGACAGWSSGTWSATAQSRASTTVPACSRKSTSSCRGPPRAARTTDGCSAPSSTTSGARAASRSSMPNTSRTAPWPALGSTTPLPLAFHGHFSAA